MKTPIPCFLIGCILPCFAAAQPGSAENFNDISSCAMDPAAPQEMIAPLAYPPLPPVPPQPPVHSIVHQYSWPNAGTNSATSFAIVLKNGQVRLAAAIWLQDGAVHFTDTQGNAVRADLRTIDVESTRKLNAQAGLRWPVETK